MGARFFPQHRTTTRQSFDERHPEKLIAPRGRPARCLNLTIRDDETIDELVARTGLSREAAAELIGFAARLAAKRKHKGTDHGDE